MIIYPVQASISGYHLKYSVDFPQINTPVSGIIYLIPTLVPLFISSIKPMRWLGVLFSVSFIITTILYREYLISVWCYFASLISALILYIIYYLNQATHKGFTAKDKEWTTDSPSSIH